MVFLVTALILLAAGVSGLIYHLMAERVEQIEKRAQRSGELADLAAEACNLLAHHHDPWWKMDETTRMCNLCRDSKVFEKMESLGLKFTGRSPNENCPPSRSTSGLVPLPQSPYSVIEGSLKKIELEDGFVSLRMTGPSLPTLGIPMIIPDGPPKHEWIEQYTWALNSAFNVGVQASERRS